MLLQALSFLSIPQNNSYFFTKITHLILSIHLNQLRLGILFIELHQIIDNLKSKKQNANMMRHKNMEE